jgi:hypothetical protein
MIYREDIQSFFDAVRRAASRWPGGLVEALQTKQ